ncbi:MAG: FIST C-terminal domain-containing protein [Myxococcales bacterium]
MEGARGREERINELLGNAAPLMSFVGGSAGDDIQFKKTWAVRAFAGKSELAEDGTALMVLEMGAPFMVLKTCSAVPSARDVKITKADPARRLVLELDGQPAAKRYAELLGTTPEKLGFPDFLRHPLGLMIDGEPWLRSLVRVEGDGLFVACAVLDGMMLRLMDPADLVATTTRALADAQITLGRPVAAGVLFNCAYRMIEAQVTGAEERYHAALSNVVHAGVHSNGESWLGHLNQTLTGLLIG